MSYKQFCDNIFNSPEIIDKSFYNFIKKLQTNNTEQIISSQLQMHRHLTQKEILIFLILHPYPITTILEILQTVSNPQWQEWNTIKLNKDDLLKEMIQKKIIEMMRSIIFDDLQENAPYWLN